MDNYREFTRNGNLSFTAEEDGLTHSMIIGDNFDALRILTCNYAGEIDIIYIDPPYGVDGKGACAEMNYGNGLDHDALCSMLRPRLALALQLLKDGGVFLCSIDERNHIHVRLLLDEIFDPKGHYGTFIQLKKNTQNDSIRIQRNHEYILCYAKKPGKNPLLSYVSETRIKVSESGWVPGSDNGNGLKSLKERPNTGYTVYLRESADESEFESLAEQAERFCDAYGHFNYYVENGNFVHAMAIDDVIRDMAVSGCQDESLVYADRSDLLNAGYIKVRPARRCGTLGSWSWSLANFRDFWNGDELTVEHGKKKIKFRRKIHIDSSEIINEKEHSYYIRKSRLALRSIINIPNVPGTKLLNSIIPGCPFKHPKNPDMLKYLFSAYQNRNAVILDFFAGSRSTGQAVMDLNREDGGRRLFILCTDNLEKDGHIATSITAPRLSRIMRGRDYDGKCDFPWLEKNTPYGDGLDVFIINKENNARIA